MPARNSGKSKVEKAASEKVNSDPQVLCDRAGCMDYGKKPRCYLDIFNGCPGYDGKKVYEPRVWI